MSQANDTLPTAQPASDSAAQASSAAREPHLVCFFSLGEGAKIARYRHRDATCDSDSVLEATLKLGLANSDDLRRRYVPVLTPQTKHAAEQLSKRLQRPQDSWEPIFVETVDESVTERIIDRMLARVHAGDHVLVEPTNGLRAFQMALIAGAIFLEAVRESVTVDRLVYGMIRPAPAGADGSQHPVAALGELHDCTEVLRMFRFARSAHAFRDNLAAEPILTQALQKDSLGGPLKEISQRLALALTPQIIRVLRGSKPLQLTGDPRAPRQPSAAERESVQLVERYLEPLRAVAKRTSANTLNGAWIEAELAIATIYAELGRVGDAAQVLRECCVNMVLLLQAVPPGPNWAEHSGRYQAERWLSRNKGKQASKLPDRLAALATLYDQLLQLRNFLSHAGYQGDENAMPPGTNITALVSRAQKLWADGLPPIEGPSPSTRGRVFVNLSNHPDWSEAQLAAARELGAERVEHIAFPAVDESLEDVSNLVQPVLAKLPADAGWAMVQGEPVLSVLLVRELQQRGIACFVGTTPRKAEPHADGKLSHFEFTRFRPWPQLAKEEHE